jgi:hypothetical protein
MRLAVAAVIAACLVSATLLAQGGSPATRPAIAGKYNGWARGSEQGDIAMTVTLVQTGATFTGTMDAGQMSFSIYDGTIDGNKLSWSFSNGEINGGVTAEYKDGVITGEWSASSSGGAIELKKQQ